MYWVMLITISILQWNSSSLIANGQDLKLFMYGQKIKSDLMCIKESWLKPNLDFLLRG